MRVSNIQIFLLVGVVSCSPGPHVPNLQPNIPPTQINIPLDTFNPEVFLTCSKDEEELNFSVEALKNSVSVTDSIDSKDIEYVDCNGAVREKIHGPVRHLNKTISIKPPSSLAASVEYVEVENSRTCGRVRAEKVQDKEFQEELVLPDGNKVKIDFPLARVTSKGQLKVPLTDSSIKVGLSLNLVEGANPIQVRYYGRCTEYQTSKDSDRKDIRTCVKGEPLGTKDLVIHLKIDRPEVSGVDRVNVCQK